MGLNIHLIEKVSEAHRQELLREAERERLLAQLPQQRQSLSKYVAGKLGTLMLWLGARLREFEQKSPTMLRDCP